MEGIQNTRFELFIKETDEDLDKQLIGLSMELPE